MDCCGAGGSRGFAHVGVIEGDRLQGFVNETLGNRPIGKLGKPFAAIAAERETSRMTVFNRGNTGIAVDVSWRESAEAALADVVIRPPTIRSCITDFNHKLENMAAGEEATRIAIPRIRELVAKVAVEKTRSANFNRVPVSALAR